MVGRATIVQSVPVVPYELFIQMAPPPPLFELADGGTCAVVVALPLLANGGSLDCLLGDRALTLTDRSGGHASRRLGLVLGLG